MVGAPAMPGFDSRRGDQMNRHAFQVLALLAGASLGALAAWWPAAPAPTGCVHESLSGKDYMWCGIPHYMDSYKFRLSEPGAPAHETWPPRGPVAVGDSFTFGVGVAAEDTWPARLGAVNAGIPGASVEEVAEVVRRFFEPSSAARIWEHPGQYQLPLASGRTVPAWPTQPTEILYGICPNDVAPSWNQDPGGTLKQGVERLYDSAEMRERFRRVVDAARGVPVRALVLWFPDGWDMIERLEDDARAAGMQVVPAAGYMDMYAGADWHVAANEMHPSEAAHAAYARAWEGR